MNFILSFCEVLAVFRLVGLSIIVDVGDTFTTDAEKLGRWNNYTSLLPRNSVMQMWRHDATIVPSENPGDLLPNRQCIVIT
jgi:hypothetical protein